VSSDGTLASAASDHTIRVWDQNLKCLGVYRGHTDHVFVVIELLDGRLGQLIILYKFGLNVEIAP